MVPDGFEIPEWIRSDFFSLRARCFELLHYKRVHRWRSWTFVRCNGKLFPRPPPGFGFMAFLGVKSCNLDDNDGQDNFVLFSAVFELEKGQFQQMVDEIFEIDLRLFFDLACEWACLFSCPSLRDYLVDTPEGENPRRQQTTNIWDIKEPENQSFTAPSTHRKEIEKLRINQEQNKKFKPNNDRGIFAYIQSVHQSPQVKSESTNMLLEKTRRKETATATLPLRYFCSREGVEILTTQRQGLQPKRTFRTNGTIGWWSAAQQGATPFFPFYPHRLRLSDGFIGRFAQGRSDTALSTFVDDVREKNEAKWALLHPPGMKKKMFAKVNMGCWLHNTLRTWCSSCPDKALRVQLLENRRLAHNTYFSPGNGAI